jgi:hypothetical protein
MAFHLIKILILLTILSVCTPVMAQIKIGPSEIDSFKSQILFRDIPIGSIVEGSVDHGGIQPHYVIDYDDKAFTPLRSYAQSIKGELDVSKKIEMLKTYITNNILVQKDYDAPAYVKLLAKYKKEGRNIPLSSYLKSKAGVCREHALVFHMALKDAGIKNTYLYARVFQGNRFEDHATNIVNMNGEMKVYDIYNSNFHNQPLNALLREGGTTSTSGTKIGIDVVNEYPAVFQISATEKKSKKTFFNFLKASRIRCATGIKQMLMILR